jgi:Fe-S cluster assembly scaffold protein SufB
MTTRDAALEELLESIRIHTGHQAGPDVARLTINENRVLGAHLVPGLEVDTEEHPDGVGVQIRLHNGVRLAKPVQLCFGMLPEEGLQRILMDVHIGENARASVIAHCTFPNAVQIEHRMDAEITVAPGAHYSYFERHIHGREGGVDVIPKAKVVLQEGARFKTEFELIKGRVGRVDIEYETTAHANSVLEMLARISGRGDDRIHIRESGHLVGEQARAALTSYIAVRDDAQAEIYNVLRADAPRARGHVDCKEIVQGRAIAKAIPIVEVNHPLAHVTHEAAIGSVDSKQLQTLLSRGLTEDEATDLIIEGMLS